MMEAIDRQPKLIMSLEQLMALAGHLAQTPRPPAAMRAASGLMHQPPVLSAEEMAALREIWRMPLRSQMADLGPFSQPVSRLKH